MTHVCRHCGSDYIHSKEQGYTWARLDITQDAEGPLHLDWPNGIGDNTDWTTIGYICGDCLADADELTKLVIPKNEFIEPTELAKLLGNLA